MHPLHEPVHQVLKATEATARVSIKTVDAKYACIKYRPTLPRSATLGHKLAMLAKPTIHITPADHLRESSAIRHDLKLAHAKIAKQLDEAGKAAGAWYDLAGHLEDGRALPTHVDPMTSAAAQTVRRAIEAGKLDKTIASEIKRHASAALLAIGHHREVLAQMHEAGRIAAANGASQFYTRLKGNTAYSPAERYQFSRLAGYATRRKEDLTAAYRIAYGKKERGHAR